MSNVVAVLTSVVLLIIIFVLAQHCKSLMDDLRLSAMHISRLKDESQGLQAQKEKVYKLYIETAARNVTLVGSLKSMKNDNVLKARVTAYAPNDNQSGMCADGDPSVTSIGLTPGWGIVAVDPDIIPYNTLMYIPGYGYAVAGDTGGALRNSAEIAIDVYMDTYKQAIDWGVQYLDVQILGPYKKEGLVGVEFKNMKEEHND